jgi:hypothetical protein
MEPSWLRGNQQFISVVLTLWSAMARPSDNGRMNDMAAEMELYMATDSEEQTWIDESGNLPPHQEPSSGSDDSGDEEDVERSIGSTFINISWAMYVYDRSKGLFTAVLEWPCNRVRQLKWSENKDLESFYIWEAIYWKSYSYTMRSRKVTDNI